MEGNAFVGDRARTDESARTPENDAGPRCDCGALIETRPPDADECIECLLDDQFGGEPPW
jgi:hypothetical protein